MKANLNENFERITVNKPFRFIISFFVVAVLCSKFYLNLLLNFTKLEWIEDHQYNIDYLITLYIKLVKYNVLDFRL
jgi:hypothetical protein